MMTFYFICLLVGLVFAVLSFVFSGAFEADVDAGVEVGADTGGDLGHDISGGDVGVGEVHFPLFSPIVIACFLAAFGGAGIVGMYLFPFMPVLSLPIALGGGLVVGLLAGLVVKAIYQKVQANAVTRRRNLIGQLAEVTEAIPASGVGQISFSGEGSLLSGPARSEENKDVKRHAMVTITRIVGGLYYVREHIDERLRDIPTDEREDKGEAEEGANE